jgi:hypothetical protein
MLLEYRLFGVRHRLADLFVLRAAVLEWAEPLVWVEIWVLVSAWVSLLV